jgi:hypothetical protein
MFGKLSLVQNGVQNRWVQGMNSSIVEQIGVQPMKQFHAPPEGRRGMK